MLVLCFVDYLRPFFSLEKRKESFADDCKTVKQPHSSLQRNAPNRRNAPESAKCVIEQLGDSH